MKILPDMYLGTRKPPIDFESYLMSTELCQHQQYLCYQLHKITTDWIYLDLYENFTQDRFMGKKVIKRAQTSAKTQQ